MCETKTHPLKALNYFTINMEMNTNSFQLMKHDHSNYNELAKTIPYIQKKNKGKMIFRVVF